MAGIQEITGLFDEAYGTSGQGGAYTTPEPLAILNRTVQGATTSTPKAMDQFILSQGRKSVLMGLEELKEGGVATDQLEKMFATVDYTDRDAVSKALSTMVSLKKSTDSDKLSQTSYKEALQTELDLIGPNASQEQIAQATARAKSQALNKSRAEGTIGDVNAMSERVGVQAGNSTGRLTFEQRLALEEVKTARSQGRDKAKAHLLALKDEYKDQDDVLAAFDKMDEDKIVRETVDALAEMKPGKRRLQKLSDPYINAGIEPPGMGSLGKSGGAQWARRAADAAGSLGFDTLLNKMAEFVNDDALKIAYRLEGGGELNLEDKEQKTEAVKVWKRSADKLTSTYTKLLSNYIKSVSGAAVSVQEETRLKSALGLAWGMGSEVFFNMWNQLVGELDERYEARKESFGRRYEHLTELTGVPVVEKYFKKFNPGEGLKFGGAYLKPTQGSENVTIPEEDKGMVVNLVGGAIDIMNRVGSRGGNKAPRTPKKPSGLGAVL